MVRHAYSKKNKIWQNFLMLFITADYKEFKLEFYLSIAVGGGATSQQFVLLNGLDRLATHPRKPIFD